jgi:2Fe-2S ferredoxin
MANPHGNDIHRVWIEPAKVKIGCAHGEPLMRAAMRARLRWPTLCGGNALCGVCFVKVINCKGDLPTITVKEASGLKLVPLHLMNPNVRLACQLPVTRDMTVERTGVVPLPTAEPQPRNIE